MNSHQYDIVKEGMALLRRLNTPRTLAMHLLAEAEEWEQVLSIKVEPGDYLTAEAFLKDNTALSFFKKMSFLSSQGDADAVALAKWLDAEELCKATNTRIRSTAGFGSVLQEAKRLIYKVLGPVPTEDVLSECRWGPGSCVGARGYLSRPDLKIKSSLTITHGAIGLVRFIGDHSVIRQHREKKKAFSVVIGNELTFVPKTAMESRPITMEPFVNLYLQLGAGSNIRHLLKYRANIDLVTGQARHRDWVKQASRDGHLATIDLSSASDTISKELVRELLPSGWYAYLDSLRSPSTVVNGEPVLLEKFSGMGNGFTFELETLIFWAICRSQSSFCSVYGDDIIVDSQSADMVLYLLQYCGLVPNKSKTFISGPFRESCGADYFDGTNVRGFYIKEADDTLESRITVINSIYDLRNEPIYQFLHPIRTSLIKKIPREDRLSGPYHTDSIHDDDQSRWVIRWKNQEKQVLSHVFTTKHVQYKAKGMTLLTLALLGMPSNGFAPRGGARKHRKRWVSSYGIHHP